MSRKPQISAIVYSEFDNTEGPKIVEQVPTGFLSGEIFDSIADFFITGRDICHKLITLTMKDCKYLSYPVCIEDPKYDRNAFFFNISFALAPDADTRPFEKVLAKLGSTLEQLELESEFLFRQHIQYHASRSGDGLEERERDTDNDAFALGFILKKIFFQLNDVGDCSVACDRANKINLKLLPVVPEPPAIHDHQVPVRIKDFDTERSDWDLTIQELVPFIDGVSFVKKVAQRTGVRYEVSLDLAKQAIQQLANARLVMMIDVFQFSNVYVPTEKIGELFQNTTLQNSCCSYVTISSSKPKPTFKLIFRLYCSLQRGVRLGAFCQKWELTLRNIDPRRFITFGLVNGIIRRIHKYPCIRALRPQKAEPKDDKDEPKMPKITPIRNDTVDESGMLGLRLRGTKGRKSVDYSDTPEDGVGDHTTVERGGEANVAYEDQEQKDEIQLDGTHSYDEICCHIGKSYVEVDSYVRAAPGCVVISR